MKALYIARVRVDSCHLNLILYYEKVQACTKVERIV